jgi:serine/threonine protein kinase/tetratricopeptide (TPR) repeat protein
MPIDLNRVQDVFQTAAELPPAERAAVLERECAGDAELLHRVEALLKAHGDSTELPAPEQTRAYTPAIEPGQVFAGRYKLREKLGEGGMGVVFVADQTEPVQRRVALKIIRAGLDTQRLLARFEQERQALALMDHPNIAKVLDAGIDQAHRPYFAMELVKGLPLTKYCDDAKLSPRQRIELFVPVCQAVQHAHQKGIIHRDLKPSNILVGLYDGHPVPKVIDFGVAKATGPRLTAQSIYTEVGSLIGTLEYMSPEQAELNNLDIDTRSDVYALGVILYELLTGTVPFPRRELEKRGLAEMLRVIKEVEPHKPSTKLSGSDTLPSIAANRHTEPKKLAALVRGELDWIVMKALEKDRGRRYETANGLALDVQRYLAGEPVLAAPASTSYRVRKFVRRNKRPVVAASLVLLALLAGVAGTTWGLIRADRERRIAQANAATAAAAAAAEKQAKERAEANFTLAKESVEKYLGTVTDDPELKNADFHKLRKKLLESALPFYQKIAEQKSDDPEVEAGRGRAYLRLALVRAALGEYDAAIEDYEAMRAIFTQLAADFPRVPDYRQELARSYHNLGLSLLNLQKRPEAEAAIRQALVIQEKLAADFPTVPEYRLELARSQNSLGVLLGQEGRRGEAEAAFRQAVGIQAKLAADFPTVPAHRQDLAKSFGNLGILLAGSGKLREAEQAFHQALAINAKFAADLPNVPAYRQGLALSQFNLGELLADLGKRGEAKAAYCEAMRIHEKLAADFPAVPEYAVDLGGGYCNFGILIRNSGQPEPALGWFQKAIARLEPLVAQEPRLVTARQFLRNSHGGRAQALDRLGHHAEATRDWERALELDDGSNKALFRLRIFRKSKDTPGCLAAAAEYEAMKRSDAASLYDAACNRAICAAVIREDHKTPSADAARLAREQADLAMAWLHKAVAAGYKDAEHIKEDTDLDALRQREDFKTLLAELTKRQATEKK